MTKRVLIGFATISLLLNVYLGSLKDARPLAYNLVEVGIYFNFLEPKFKMDLIVRDALHQAISLEKIPGISSYVKDYLMEQDTLLICPVNKSDPESSVRELRGEFPAHIDKWIIKIVSPLEIQDRSVDKEFYYIKVYISTERKLCKVDFILDLAYPPDKNWFTIDRGRLTVIFEYAGGNWKIRNLIEWFG